MANYLYGSKRHVSEFQYDLCDPNELLTDEEFERIRSAVAEWSDENDVPVEVRRTRTGFDVAITHRLKDGDVFGMSLYLHLSTDIFRQGEGQAAASLVTI